jgi:hypothetical protein
MGDDHNDMLPGIIGVPAAKFHAPGELPLRFNITAF